MLSKIVIKTLPVSLSSATELPMQDTKGQLRFTVFSLYLKTEMIGTKKQIDKLKNMNMKILLIWEDKRNKPLLQAQNRRKKPLLQAQNRK